MTAASSLDTPSAILAQNCRRCSRRLTGGRPGDFIGDRPVSSFIQAAGLPINTSTIEMLQRPVESAQNQAIEMAQMVILKHLGPEDEHGHDELELIAGMLRQAMSDHLEGRDERPERLPQPRSRKALKSTSTSVTTNAG